MKKITVIMLAIMICIVFSACGKNNEEGTNVQSSTEQSTTEENKADKEILEAFYSEYYEGEKSGKIIRDFDGDGTEDMIACEYEAWENMYIKHLNIYYIKINGKNIEVVDHYSFQGEWGEAPYGDSEHVELYINENSQLLLNVLSRGEGIQGHFKLLKIGENEITEEKHLFDPGYSSGLGLFYYDNYFNHYDETEPLYEAGIETVEGIYPTYKEALEGELGIYGFSWKLWEMADKNDFTSEKYVVGPTEKVELIFENYNFEGIDIEEYHNQMYMELYG